MAIQCQKVSSVGCKIGDKLITKKLTFFMSHLGAQYRFEEISPAVPTSSAVSSLLLLHVLFRRPGVAKAILQKPL